MANERWRVGRKVSLNIYDGNRPVCQCHDAEDAARIVVAVNANPGPNAVEKARSTVIGIAQEWALGMTKRGVAPKARQMLSKSLIAAVLALEVAEARAGMDDA